MTIHYITIENYKSLKSLQMRPSQLSVVVGANASGKSNLADCLDFVSDVYDNGLEVAVLRKGGYENLAFRRVRRSKSPIKIEIQIDLPLTDWPFRLSLNDPSTDISRVRLEHGFSFVARGSSIRAPFVIVEENLSITRNYKNGQENKTILTRSQDGSLNIDEGGDTRDSDSRFEQAFNFRRLELFRERSQPLPSTELFVTTLSLFTPVMTAFLVSARGIYVYQINPSASRNFGVPTPTPKLERTGNNLPAMIDEMQKNNPEQWDLVMQTMSSILPELDSIKVDYTPNRLLGLYFNERGVGRAWNVSEVSDGTIQTLALLVAIYDTTSNFLVIEEPENSIHPWIIRHIINACREADKQIMLTTHSPVVINAMNPEEVWVMWKKKGTSNLKPLTQLDPGFLALWKEGEVATFEYLDSGVLLQSIPPSPFEEEYTEDE